MNTYWNEWNNFLRNKKAITGYVLAKLADVYERIWDRYRGRRPTQPITQIVPTNRYFSGTDRVKQEPFPGVEVKFKVPWYKVAKALTKVNPKPIPVVGLVEKNASKIWDW